MRPVYLSIEGINSFREKQEIDFERLTTSRLFCITGCTGAGKTTVLDCVILSLYGSTGRVRTLRELINLECERAEVTFEFDAEDEDKKLCRFRVSRVFRRLNESGNGARLYKDGVQILSKREEVNKYLGGIIGLSREDFTQIVVLEQGKFDKFLNAKPTDRALTVGKIFRLDKYRSLYRLASLEADKLDKELNISRARTERFETLTETELKETRAALADLEKEKEAASAAAAEAGSAREKISAALEKYQAYLKQKQEEEKCRLAFEEIKLRLAKSEEKLQTLPSEDDLKTLSERLTELKVQKERIKAAKEKEDVLKKDSQKLAGMRAEFSAERAGAEADENALKRLEIEKKRIKAQISGITSETALIASFKSGDSPGEAFAALKSSLISAQRELKANALRAAAAKRSLDSAAVSVAEQEEREKQLNKELAALNISVADAQREFEAAKAADQARAAAKLRKGLKAGDLCPVCGGTVSAAVSKQDFACKEEEAFAAAEQNLNDMTRRQAVLKEGLAAAAASLVSAKAHAEECRTAAAELECAAALDGVLQPLRIEEGIRLCESGGALVKKAEELEKEGAALSSELLLRRSRLEALEKEGKRLKENLADVQNRLDEVGLGKAAEDAEKERSLEEETLVKAIAAAQSDKLAAEKARDELKRMFEKYSEELSRLCALPEAEKAEAEDVAAAKEREEQARKSYVQLAEKVAALTLGLSASEENYAVLKAERKKRKVASERLDRLNVLKKLFKGEKFTEFVAAEYIREFTAAASERLSSLTYGKYALSYDGKEFFVIDYLRGGEKRSVSTLSGGETFLASLSVAVAVSKQIATGKNFEFFFLDEGFGTLHSDALDSVAEALKKLSEETLVGVVSHRSELVERIPARIAVTAATGEKGSLINVELA